VRMHVTCNIHALHIQEVFNGQQIATERPFVDSLPSRDVHMSLLWHSPAIIRALFITLQIAPAS